MRKETLEQVFADMTREELIQLREDLQSDYIATQNLSAISSIEKIIKKLDKFLK